MNVAERFGQNVVAIRKQTGLSQEQLAARAGLHRTEVGMIERGIRLARIDTLLKLAGGLEATPGELLAGMQWRQGPERRGHFRTSGGAES